jgi:hypothetical protein
MTPLNGTGYSVVVTSALSLRTEAHNRLLPCHAQGITHRDLKPENIFMFDGVAKIGDFGMATSVSDPAALSERCGTSVYMTPEVGYCVGLPHGSGHIDILVGGGWTPGKPNPVGLV